jgi:antitoxin YefM
MSLEDYASVEETLHLLRSPANANRLLSTVAELTDGRGEARDLSE